jgi:hypothetical protein
MNGLRIGGGKFRIAASGLEFFDMSRNHKMRRVGLAVLVLTPLLALIATTGSATAQVQYCSQVPIV